MKDEIKYLGTSALARELGVSRQSVGRAEAAGRITRGQNNLFDAEQTRKAWIQNTHPARLGINQPPAPTPVEHKPLIDFWLQLFNDSAGPTALLLTQETNLTPKEVWHFMGTVFLIQWETIAGIYADGGEWPLELSGVAELLANDEGRRELELWLKKSTCSA